MSPLLIVIAILVVLLCVQRYTIQDTKFWLKFHENWNSELLQEYNEAYTRLNSRRQRKMEKVYRGYMKRAYKRDPNMRNFDARSSAARTLTAITIPSMIVNKPAAHRALKVLRNSVQRANMLVRLPG